MKTGTKSVLFGVHQFIWHPITVYAAWRRLNGRPTWREIVCIIVHDWGYWGCDKMDDEKGEQHPELGARIAGKLFGNEHHDLVLLHSRHLANRLHREPSKLCWPDKYSITYEPAWWYLFRARLSGELKEYRAQASKWISPDAPDKDWFCWIQFKLAKSGRERIPACVNSSRIGVENRIEP